MAFVFFTVAGLALAGSILCESALAATMAAGLVMAEPAQARPDVVGFRGDYSPGTIVVKTNERRLYLVVDQGRAVEVQMLPAIFMPLESSSEPARTTTKPGFGPDTRIMMKFNVVGAASADPPLAITAATDLTGGLDPFPVPPGVAVQNGIVNLPPGTPVRQLTLNEAFDSLGRLIQLVGPNTLNPILSTQLIEALGEAFVFDPLIATDPEGRDVPILALAVLSEGVLIFLFHARVGQVVMDVLVALLGLLVLLGIRCYVLLPTLRAESVAEPEPALP